ncbi:MAG: hypothetical protein HYW65_00785 [Candidatus Liptonbacteria bacterium]|nr:hypothetical protein [Candidatus Liptonbacteria bacterium]
MPRLIKQLLYGLLYFVIFIGIPVGIYFALLKPAPTCWDAVQNGTEEGIDCGGGCPRACIPATLQPLEAAGGVKVVPLGRDANGFFHESFLIEITNPNTEYAAQSFRYTITAETISSTATLQRLDGDAYIYAGEVRTLAFPNIIVGEHEVQSASITFSDPQWVPASLWRRPSLRVQHTATERTDGQLVVSGELVSDDIIAFPFVEVIAVFKGRFGEVVGVSRTQLEEVAPASPRAFTVFHPDVADADLGATSITLTAVRP